MGILRKITDRAVGALGYAPFLKSELPERGKFKSMSLNTTRGYQNRDGVQKNGLRKPGKVTFRILRQIAKHDAVTRVCVNVIKKAVSQSDWRIVVKPKAPGDKKADYEKEIERATDLFEFMNMNGENMRVILDRVIEDLLILDAGVIEIVRSMDGKDIVALNSVDGATIRPVYNEYGELGEPAYYQFMFDKKVAEFSMDDVVYMMANPQNDVDLFGYGLSPIESILLIVQASLEADMYNIKHFTKDNIPSGLLDLGDMTQDQAEDFIATWNATVVGNNQSMKFVYGSNQDKKFIPFNSTNKDMQYAEYIEWLTRIKLATFGLSGIDANLMQDVNRATAKVQHAISNSRGVRSTKRLIEEYFTRQVLKRMNSDNENFKWLEFKFMESEAIDEKSQQAGIDKIYVETGVMRINEIREREGLEPIDEMAYSEELDSTIRNAMNMKEETKSELEKPKKKKPVFKGFYE